MLMRSLREFFYLGAAVTAFLVILGIAAFAQTETENSGVQRFAQDRINSERLQRFDQDGRSDQNRPADQGERFNQSRRFDQRDRFDHGGRGQHNQPGQFDFYVLALSWSPSFCEASRERGRGGRSDQQQCGARPYSFVVHGLWPQHERGFPRECQVPAPRLARSIVYTMLDLMPSERLVFNQWDRHGTCSGLNGQQYFETVRKAREAVQIPAKFQEISEYKMVTPDEVEDAFVTANPGLSREGIAVTCDSRRLSEVRICMSKDLNFRACPEIDRRACRNDKVVMPPVRGG
jgi:ribonuclease T2